MQQNLVQIHLVVYIHILFYLLLYTFYASIVASLQCGLLSLLLER